MSALFKTKPSTAVIALIFSFEGVLLRKLVSETTKELAPLTYVVRSSPSALKKILHQSVCYKKKLCIHISLLCKKRPLFQLYGFEKCRYILSIAGLETVVKKDIFHMQVIDA